MGAEWVPDGIDLERPSAARIYDYLLGGSHNFAVDRDVARAAIAAMPDVAIQAQANRAFLHRAVRYLATIGVHQFLDLGSGIPTLGSVHEIAQGVAPDARVVYVDIDPVAVAHSRHLLDGNDAATVLHHDLRRPDRILADVELHTVLDLERPVAVLALAVLHAMSDADDPGGVIARFRDALAPGSFLVIAHGADSSSLEETKRLVEISARTPTPLNLRTAAEIRVLFDGFELVEPGLVWAPLWHPEHPDDLPERPERSGNLVGVGRKR